MRSSTSFNEKKILPYKLGIISCALYIELEMVKNKWDFDKIVGYSKWLQEKPIKNS